MFTSLNVIRKVALLISPLSYNVCTYTFLTCKILDGGQCPWIKKSKPKYMYEKYFSQLYNMIAFCLIYTHKWQQRCQTTVIYIVFKTLYRHTFGKYGFFFFLVLFIYFYHYHTRTWYMGYTNEAFVRKFKIIYRHGTEKALGNNEHIRLKMKNTCEWITKQVSVGNIINCNSIHIISDKNGLMSFYWNITNCHRALEFRI